MRSFWLLSALALAPAAQAATTAIRGDAAVHPVAVPSAALPEAVPDLPPSAGSIDALSAPGPDASVPSLVAPAVAAPSPPLAAGDRSEASAAVATVMEPQPDAGAAPVPRRQRAPASLEVGPTYGQETPASWADFLAGADAAPPARSWLGRLLADYVRLSRRLGDSDEAAAALISSSLEPVDTPWQEDLERVLLPVARRALKTDGPLSVEPAVSGTGAGFDPVFRVLSEEGDVLAYAKLHQDRPNVKTLRELVAYHALNDVLSRGAGGVRLAEPLGSYRLADGAVLHFTRAAPGRGLLEHARDGAGVRLLAMAEALGAAFAEIHGNSPRGRVNEQEKGWLAGFLRDWLGRLDKDPAPVDAGLRESLRARSEALIARYTASEQVGTYVHGDANPFNLLVDDALGVSAIDYRTAFHSLGEDLSGNRSPAADIGRYVEMLDTRNALNSAGLGPGEVRGLQQAFLSGWSRRAARYDLQLEGLRDAIELYRLLARVMALGIERDPARRAFLEAGARRLLESDPPR